MLYCRVCQLALVARASITQGSGSPGLNLMERDEALTLLLEDLRERLRDGVPEREQDEIATRPIHED